MPIFWKNTVKIASALGAAASDPRIVTPTYCYNFVEFVSSVKMRFNDSSVCSAFTSYAFLHIFAT